MFFRTIDYSVSRIILEKTSMKAYDNSLKRGYIITKTKYEKANEKTPEYI